ncbi:zinc metallopeptidase [bacterium]|nr:zinc metallopeptidase [bacterium]
MSYWVMIILFIVVSSAVRRMVGVAIAKGHKVRDQSGMTGIQAAERALIMAGVSGIRFGVAPADHYDPRTRTINLTPENGKGRSVTAIAIALHETGHAVQHAKADAFFGVRSAIFPVANIGSNMAFPLILIGMFTGYTNLLWLGIIAFGGAVLFHIVTLPVEFDASARAMRMADEVGVLEGRKEGVLARGVLRAAALTYVVAALIALIQLLHYIGIARRR